MTSKALIDYLKAFDPDAPVCIDIYDISTDEFADSSYDITYGNDPTDSSPKLIIAVEAEKFIKLLK